MTGFPTLSAFQHAPSLGVSTWHRGGMVTYLAEAEDTGGSYCLIDALMEAGKEPPPHVHTREDELFYVLDGSFDVYIGEESFGVEKGGCVFLPRFKPHAFIIRSSRLHVLALFTPGGIEKAFRVDSVPAKALDLPTEAVTYPTEHLEASAQRLLERGVRLLTPDEIASQMPSYRRPPASARYRP
jgi:mannose-6-phosphate isomerase-like protein (cupin superfamily)